MDRSPRVTHELSIRSDGATIAASYSPAGRTALIALHGASSGTRDHFLYRHLHDVLPPAGVGVMTFDRRGEGGSTGEPSRGRFAVQVGDALAIAETLDADRIGVWGFSQGGWIAPLVAVASDRIAFVVGVASTGVTPSAQMMYATAEQLRRAGYGPSVVTRVLTLRRSFETWVHAPTADGGLALETELGAAHNEPWWSLAFLPTSLPDEGGRHLWIEEMDFDPRPIFDQVRVPALMFYGEHDSWTPVGPSIDAWRQTPRSDVETVVIPEAGHDLTLPDGTLAPAYERQLIDWLTW